MSAGIGMQEIHLFKEKETASAVSFSLKFKNKSIRCETSRKKNFIQKL